MASLRRGDHARVRAQTMADADLTRLLQDAILSNAPARVAQYLESGASVINVPRMPSLKSKQYTEWEGKGKAATEITKIDTSATFCHTDPSYTMTPLHVAIVNCYKQLCDKASMEIVQLLVDHGADLKAAARDISACNIPGYYWLPLNGAALTFALKLKAACMSSESFQATKLEALVAFLHEQLSGGAKSLALPMTRVPSVARETWSGLLLNDLCSDVTLVCADEELPAHTCVLASASEYFRQLFTGPWRTQVADGKLSTSVSAEVMRGVLSFIYVGEIEPALVEREAEAVFSVAQQYFLRELSKLAEARLLGSIGVDTLKRLLVLADLHDAQALKQQCIAFVRQNKVTALTAPSMLGLAGEKPALWAELVEMASANEPAAKRARTEEAQLR